MATTLALAALGASTAHAQALPLPLQNAVVKASYNDDNAGMLGLLSGFESGPNSHITTLDPTDIGVEFFTADALFGVDFSAAGALTVIANIVPPPGAYSMRFDFGSSLSLPISSLSFTGANGASGVPVLSIIDAHTLALDLSGVTWSEFGSFTAQITTASPVPELPPAAMLAAGLASLAGVMRLRQRRRQG